MYRNVMMYQIMVDILKGWLENGVISQKDYRAMHTTMAEKYGISLSGIFVDNSSVMSSYGTGRRDYSENIDPKS